MWPIGHMPPLLLEVLLTGPKAQFDGSRGRQAPEHIPSPPRAPTGRQSLSNTLRIVLEITTSFSVTPSGLYLLGAGVPGPSGTRLPSRRAFGPKQRPTAWHAVGAMKNDLAGR